MTKEEALEIIKKENLSVNWFDDHLQEPFEMVIKLSDEGIYQVYGTDERASVLGITEEFTSLEDALDNLLYKARLLFHIGLK